MQSAGVLLSRTFLLEAQYSLSTLRHKGSVSLRRGFGMAPPFCKGRRLVSSEAFLLVSQNLYYPATSLGRSPPQDNLLFPSPQEFLHVPNHERPPPIIPFGFLEQHCPFPLNAYKRALPAHVFQIRSQRTTPPLLEHRVRGPFPSGLKPLLSLMVRFLLRKVYSLSAVLSPSNSKLSTRTPFFARLPAGVDGDEGRLLVRNVYRFHPFSRHLSLIR